MSMLKLWIRVVSLDADWRETGEFAAEQTKFIELVEVIKMCKSNSEESLESHLIGLVEKLVEEI